MKQSSMVATRKQSVDRVLNKDTLQPLQEIINESQRANKSINQQKAILHSGIQKTLPYRQERMLKKVFQTLLKCDYDASGLNKDWLTSISVDERSMIKKFFRDSGPQFIALEDYWVEEFCRKLRSIVVPAGSVLKRRETEPDRLYILITGKVSIDGRLFNSPQTTLVNDYYPGQSFADPLLNETAAFSSHVTVVSNRPAMLYYLDKSAYIQIYIDRLNELSR